MAVFTSFSDEAETGSLSHFLVSGYIAEEKNTWSLLAGAWQERVLDGPPKIPYLHMTQIRNKEWRAKQGNLISIPDAESRIEAAVDLLSKCGGLLVATSEIKRADLKAAILSKKKSWTGRKDH